MKTMRRKRSCNMPLSKITPPPGWPKDKPWTEKEAKEAMEVAGLGLSRDDFSDDGADLQDLKDIMEGNND